MQTLGNRMKSYEAVSQRTFPQNSDIILRLDGRAFHTLTKDVEPFDHYLRRSMRDATETLFQDMGKVGVLAYTQSDEISILLSDACDTKVEQWFGGNTDKINTIAASIVSVAFSEGYGRAHFDCRSFFIPRSEVANYFLWRAQDCARNSLSMLCHVYFTHKELEGKGYREQHEMLHGIGINWTKELRPEFRNGLFISKKSESVDTLPSYADVSTVVETAYAEQTQLKGVDYLP